MISMLICNKSAQELEEIQRESKDLAGKMTEENWNYYCFTKRKEFEKFLEKSPILNLAVVDIMMQGGLSGAKQVRKNDRSTYLILIASSSCSPLLYMKPDILAGSLLLRPYTKKQIQEVLREAFLAWLCQRESEDLFVIENRSGKQMIPYGKIIYFEAFERKIRVHTEEKETVFYGTIDHLVEELPERFVRCHRGFVIDKFRIRQIQLSKNLVILEGDYQIPLSRSYKEAIKKIAQHKAKK